jgi:hypothetical protein
MQVNKEDNIFFVGYNLPFEIVDFRMYNFTGEEPLPVDIIT